jgi:hypothetical protein
MPSASIPGQSHAAAGLRAPAGSRLPPQSGEKARGLCPGPFSNSECVGRTTALQLDFTAQRAQEDRGPEYGKVLTDCDQPTADAVWV